MKAEKIEAIKMKQNNNYEIRTALLEQTCSNINQSLIRLENKIDTLDKKIEVKIDALDKKIDSKIDNLEKKIETLDKKIDSKFDIIDKKIDSIHSRIWHLFLCGVGAFAGMLALIAHAEKWI
jgi:hypothetical protein